MNLLQIKWFPGSDRIHLPEAWKHVILRAFTIDGATDLVESIVILCSFITLFLFLVLMIGKSIHIRRLKRTKSILKDCEALLSIILFEYSNPELSTRKNKLMKSLLRRRFSSEILLNEVLKLHSSLAGETGEQLREFYMESGLKDLSVRKLRSRKWYVMCRGCQEVAQMNVKSATVRLKVLTAHRTPAVREQAQIAYIEMAGFKGIDFVFSYQLEITYWQQLNLIRTLEKHANELPDLPTLQLIRNESVITFILRLITHFQIHDADQLLLQSVRQQSEEIRLLCVRAAAVLHREDLKGRILLLYGYSSEPVQEAILDCLNQLGTYSDLEFLEEVIYGGKERLMFHAVKAYRTIGGTDRALRLSEKIPEVKSILRHLSDPLLNE